MQHFQDGMIIINKNGTQKLTLDALPTIFRIRNSGTDSGSVSPASSIQSPMCPKCSDSNTKIADLEAQILKLRMDHDVTLQSMRRRIDELIGIKKSMAIDLTKLRKQILEQEKQLSQSYQRFFTANGNEIPNVSR